MLHVYPMLIVLLGCSANIVHFTGTSMPGDAWALDQALHKQCPNTLSLIRRLDVDLDDGNLILAIPAEGSFQGVSETVSESGKSPEAICSFIERVTSTTARAAQTTVRTEPCFEVKASFNLEDRVPDGIRALLDVEVVPTVSVAGAMGPTALPPTSVDLSLSPEIRLGFLGRDDTWSFSVRDKGSGAFKLQVGGREIRTVPEAVPCEGHDVHPFTDHVRVGLDIPALCRRADDLYGSLVNLQSEEGDVSKVFQDQRAKLGTFWCQIRDFHNEPGCAEIFLRADRRNPGLFPTCASGGR